MRYALALLCLAPLAFAQDDAPAPLSGSLLIDTLLQRDWKDQGIVPAQRAGDAEFLRRATLDLIGTLPAPDEVLAFLKNPQRPQKIEALLRDERYARHWAERWEDLLVGYDGQTKNDSKSALQGWLRDEVFTRNLPYNQMVAALLASTGVNTEIGPVNFLLKLAQKGGGPIVMASVASRLFMSTQIQCAQCHDHPFDRFTQEDFHGMVAFFARTKSRKVEKDDPKDTRLELYDAPAGEASFGEGKQKKNVPPRFLDEIAPPEGLSRREGFVKLLTSQKNPNFAKSIVNRYWSHFFGRGIIDPVDDFSNRFKPSHAELLDRLAKDFVLHDYDLSWLVRAIANSEAYQRSSRQPQPVPPERAFAVAATRPLTPGQLCQCLLDALDAPAPKNRADLLRQFRQRFGDEEMPDRGLFQGTIPQALMLMNGALPNGEIGKTNNRLDKILKASPDPEQRLERIFLSIVSRLPDARERSAFLAHVQSAGARKEPYEDVCWVLLNSSEFLFNH